MVVHALQKMFARLGPTPLLAVALLSLGIAVPFVAEGQSLDPAPVELTATQSVTLPLAQLQHLHTQSPDEPLEVAIAAHAAGKFGPARAEDLGVSTERHWIRWSMRNSADRASTHHLALNRPFQADARVYIQREETTELILTESRNQRFDDRLRAERMLVSLPIPLAPNEQVTVWVRHGVDGSALPNWSLLTPQDLQDQKTRQSVSMAVFYVAALIIAVFMLGFVLVLRTWAQVYYFGFFVCLLAYNAQLEGVLFQYLWPWAPGWNAVGSHVIGLAGIICAALAAQSFIHAAERHPLYRRIVLGFVLITALLMLAPIFAPIASVKLWAGPLVLIFLLLHFTAAFCAVRDRPGGWPLFALGSIVLFGYLGLFTVGTQIPGLVPPDILSVLIRYGQLIDGTLFSASAIVQTMHLRKVAEQHQHDNKLLEQTLAATRHDMQQPLLAMRATLSALESSASSAREVDDLRQSIAFLEDIVDAPTGSGPADTRDPVPLTLVLDGVRTVLGAEAVSAGVDLRIVSSSAQFDGDPLIMMRAVSNLVTNALRHSQSDRVLVGVRPLGPNLMILVADRGRGFDPDTVKPDPDGAHGIGLSATRAAMISQDWHLAFHRTAGGTTIATINGIRRA